MTDQGNVHHLAGDAATEARDAARNADGDNRLTHGRFLEILDEYERLEKDVVEIRAAQKILKEEVKRGGFRIQAFTHWRWRRKQSDIASFDEEVRMLDELREQPELPLEARKAPPDPVA